MGVEGRESRGRGVEGRESRSKYKKRAPFTAERRGALQLWVGFSKNLL